MNKVDISVIIASYNGSRHLGKCLESLVQSAECKVRSKSKKFQNSELRTQNSEIIVVDDGSEDDSIEIMQKSKIKYQNDKLKIKIIKNKKNLGAAEARNIGAKAARGRYLFFLDVDTVIGKDWAETIVDIFENHPEISVAQAKLLKMGTNRFDYAGDLMGPFGFLVERARSAADCGQFDRFDRIFSLKSAGMIVRKEVFEKIGGFDKDYHYIIEDTDFGWRSWLAGYPVYFAWPLKVWHTYGQREEKPAAATQNRYAYLGSRNTITTLVKNLGTKKLVTVLPLNIACWLVIGTGLVMTGKVTKGIIIYRGIAASLRGLPRAQKKRKIIQRKRVMSDGELFSQVGTRRKISYYLGKAAAYIGGRPF